MAIRKIIRHGQVRLFIDIRYKGTDGRRERFRKDAKVQILAAARTEEKRYLVNIAQFGYPYGPTNGSCNGDPDSAPFAEVVEQYKSTFMITDLKVTSRRGYTSVLDGTLLPKLGEMPITKIDSLVAADLDLDLTKRNLARTTRNNVQCVLRSVLRFAKNRGHIKDIPANMPRLRPVGLSILEIPTEEQVDMLLAAATPCQRLAFALVAYAGLRPNEVRALRRGDVQLRHENGIPVGGFLSIREGRSHGETHTPKTGQREIPCAPPLARLLGQTEKGPRNKYVAVNERGRPWGQYGIMQAFKRVRDRVGLEQWSVYSFRHYAITSWLRIGIPVHVVQRMAGHKNLETTQHYVHFLKEDLEDAARRLSRAAEAKTR